MRWQLPFGVFIAAAVAVSYGERTLVESIGRSVGTQLAACVRIANWTRRPVSAAPSWTGLLHAEGPRTQPVSIDRHNVGNGSPNGKRKPRRRKVAGRVDRTMPSSLSVRAATVLRLAESGARPSGVPVPASGVCPAGIALAGVSGLGLGLRDGDVLVRAAGMPARDPAAVINAVVSSRGARVPVISGQICREGALISLVVEQPYLNESGLGSDSAYDKRCLDPTLAECDAGVRADPGG
jgi:hypothetical protein